MTMIKNYMAYFAVLALLFTSCSKEESGVPVTEPSAETAVLTFGTQLNDLVTRAANSKQHFNQIPDCVDDATPTTARLTISYGEVTKTIDVDILSDDDGNYFTDYSDQLEIPVEVNDNDDNTDDFTTVTLEEFMVYDGDPSDMDNLIWVAPTGDGDFTGYVDNPLPFDIIVRPGVKKYVPIEVLCFDRRMVNQYGYLFFDIDNKELIELCLFGNYCTPDGRHYVANYSVDVFIVNDDGSLGVQLYDGVQPEYGPNVDDDNAASPLCLVLPDDPDVEDNYYVEIRLEDGNDYDSDEEGEIVKTLNINDVGVRAFFNSDNVTSEYAHFFVNCDEEDIFEEPGSKNYNACLKPLNGSEAVAIVSLSLDGNNLNVIVNALNMVPNQTHPQHIHGFLDDSNATCPDSSADTNEDGIISVSEGVPFYGDILLPLKDFPMANGAGTINYEENFTLTDEQLADITPLENKVVVLHGLNVDGTYMPTIPVACNGLKEVGIMNP